MFHPTVRDLLSQSAARSPTVVALRDPGADRSLTFAEWDEHVTRMANGLLDAGLSAGDHLAVMVADSIEQLTLLFACAEVGAVFTPLSYRAPVGRLSYILDHSGATGLAFDEWTVETVEQLASDERPQLTVATDATSADASDATPYETLAESTATPPDTDVDEDDPVLLLYTSGTTGQPKGVRHRHRAVVESNLVCLPYNRLRPSDVNIALGPLYHVGPLLANFMPALHVGATNVVQREFDPTTTLDRIEREEITAMWGVPTHFNELLNEGDLDGRDVSHVRMIQYSGSAMPREVVTRCREQFPGVDFVNAYGATEIVFGTILYPEDHDAHLGSIGQAVPNAEVRLVDPENPVPDRTVERGEPGEILVRAPTRMEGYWNDPERTAAAIVDGWYRTGDLARRDAAGFIYFVDRKDNMIISGGENIYPAEVEDVLYEYPGVVEAAVVGTPDDRWGELVTAFVVADGSVTEADLDAYLQSSDDLEAFKRPRQYHFRDELPTTASGKIARDELEREVTG